MRSEEERKRIRYYQKRIDNGLHRNDYMIISSKLRLLKWVVKEDNQ